MRVTILVRKGRVTRLTTPATHVRVKIEMIGPRRVVALLVGMAVLLVHVFAGAETRVPFLSDQLQNGADFRVRTQAALALGASDDPDAVRPLCNGLDDTNQTVRGAAAAGLAKLGKTAGLACLKRHADDTSPAVKSVIARAIEGIESKKADGVAGPPPPPGANDSYYVAIGATTDKTGRGGNAVATLVRASMQNKLLSMSGYAVAPAGESQATGRKVVKQKKLKGFLLQARVEPPRYDGGDLTVQVRVTLFSYPGKALQGEFAPKMTMSGVGSQDPGSEDTLIKMAVERAMDSLAMVAASTD